MFRRAFTLFGISSLFVSPVAGQFGLGKKKGGSFQELNEQAKQMGGGAGGGGGDLAGLGDLGDLASMFGDIDPKQLEQLAGLGGQFDEIMDVMSKLSPAELEKQMQDAMEMLTGGDMMKNMLGMQDEIIKTLEDSGQVTPEELAKFKADPEYFEQKMLESFDQMKDLFSDPETLKAATESIKSVTDLYSDPSKLEGMLEQMLGDLNDDDKIEEIRLQLLQNPDMGLPGLSEAFSTPEMQEVLKDSKKWRESVKEGKGLLNTGAGVGEL